MIYEALLCRGAEVYRRVHIVTDGMIPDSYRLRHSQRLNIGRFEELPDGSGMVDCVEYFRLVGEECHNCHCLIYQAVDYPRNLPEWVHEQDREDALLRRMERNMRK